MVNKLHIMKNLDSDNTIVNPKILTQSDRSILNRRQFIERITTIGTTVFWGNLLSCTTDPVMPVKNNNILNSVLIIDAHSHPENMCRGDINPSIEDMQNLGMEASSFCVVGDALYLNHKLGMISEVDNTIAQLHRGPKKLINLGKVKPVYKTDDIPKSIGLTDPPGAIMAIEGGDPLEGKPNRVDLFYNIGVRMITIIHRRHNEIGDSMNPMTNENWHGGLTPEGIKIIERMQEIGIIVDVAHTHKKTLEQISKISSAPLIDSHTNPGNGHRQRGWKEMEQVAKTGGVVCTWPQAFPGRSSFRNWAKEILKMKHRIGIEHAGLGTDGGGLNDSSLIKGYKNIPDLIHLATAMQEIGLSRKDISAYMGNNFYRVFQQCVG